MRLNDSQIRYARSIINLTCEESFLEQYYGILLCEGTESSVDVCLYSKLYPHLYVIPVGGWSNVIAFHNYLKKRVFDCPVYGLIDRDDLSKKQINNKKITEDIYCTKLPFIENIISSPKIINIIGKELCRLNYVSSQDVGKKLLRILCRRLVCALPVNIGVDEKETIKSITIRIEKEDGEIIEKSVNEDNIMYAYRDKSVANETAMVLGITGKKKYYDFFKMCLENPKLSRKILKYAKRYLPNIP